MKKILVLAMLFSVSAVFAEVLWEPATIRDFENRRPFTKKKLIVSKSFSKVF